MSTIYLIIFETGLFKNISKVLDVRYVMFW